MVEQSIYNSNVVQEFGLMLIPLNQTRMRSKGCVPPGRPLSGLSLFKVKGDVSRAHDSLERSIVAFGINMRVAITPLTFAIPLVSGFIRGA